MPAVVCWDQRTLEPVAAAAAAAVASSLEVQRTLVVAVVVRLDQRT